MKKPIVNTPDSSLVQKVRDKYQLESWAQTAALIGMDKGTLSGVLAGERELSLLQRLRCHDMNGAAWAATALRELGLGAFSDKFIAIAQDQAQAKANGNKEE